MEIVIKLIISIIFAIIVSILFTILGAVSFKYLYLPYRRRTNALSRLSPLDFSKDPVYLCYGLIPPGVHDNNYTVAQGDLSAIALGYQVLADNYEGERIRIQNCVATEPHLNEVSNLLTISGPRWNGITERYMGRLGSPLQFADDRKAVILHKPGDSQKTFANTYRTSGDPEVCYGIVIGGIVKRGGRAQKVLICAGSNSFSTYGCVITLDELRRSRSLRRMGQFAELRSQSRWGMIVRVQNLSPTSAVPRGLLPFEESQLEVEVERTLVAAEFSEPFVF